MLKTNNLRPANDLQNPNKSHTFKVVLLGEMSVGKSCLVNRLVKDKFNKLQNTIGAAFCTYTIQIGNTPVKMEIWDTAGQERYHGLVPMYYRHTQAAIIVYDITNRVTFENAKKWMLKLENQVPGIVTILVGNKVDLLSMRSVQTDEAQTFANENYLLFMETSAKTNVNVTKVFREIAAKYVEIQTSQSNITEKSRRLDKSDDTVRGNCCK